MTQIPEDMTGDKLRLVADWLDTYDRLARNYFNLHETLLGTSAEELAEVRAVVDGKDVQADLRRWADQLDGAERPLRRGLLGRVLPQEERPDLEAPDDGMWHSGWADR